MKFCLSSRWVLFLIILAVLALAAVSNHASIAFVFAGSARSFMYPLVYRTIRHNLINAFCNKPCHSHVFARISLSDNTHQQAGFDARGKFEESDETLKPYVEKALLHLSREAMYEFVNIGSIREQEEIRRYIGNSTMLRIYNDLDPRRFNMYFNRMLAYHMAINYETKHAIRFNWIVHSRLDMFWGSPLAPFHQWNPRRVWVPDTWASDVPDTVALLPKHLSDPYYSVDAMYVDRRVGCLGGPNFDPSSVTVDSLRRRNYSEAVVQLALSEVCLTKFPDKSQLERDDEKNITWTSTGLSEIMLKRKLDVYGISDANNTLGFSSMFAVIVRHPLSIECFYTQVLAFITWARPYMIPSHTVNNGCRYLDSLFRFNDELRKNYLLEGENCNSNSVDQRIHINNNVNNSNNKSATTSLSAITTTMTKISSYFARKNDDITVDQTVASCAMTPELNNFNFLPFRLRMPTKLSTCLTTYPNEQSYQTKEISVLRGRPCEDIIDIAGSKIQYSPHQLFGFLPGTTRPQRIQMFPAQGQQLCLTVSTPQSKHPEEGTPINLQRCDEAKRITDISMLFIVSWKEPSKVELARSYFTSSNWKRFLDSNESEVFTFSKNMNQRAGKFQFAEQISRSAGHHSNSNNNNNNNNNPSQSFNYLLLELRWVGAQQSYCVVFDSTATGTTAAATTGMITGIAILKACDSNTNSLDQLFLAEQSKIVTPTKY